MSKTFFEVFPTLKVNQNIEMMFQGVEVTKVATNTNRDFIRVHILGKHLLQKKTVYDAEQLLKEQRTGGDRGAVRAFRTVYAGESHG